MNPVYSYDLIKYLFLPFTQWPAYEAGIIDDKGKKLRKPKEDEKTLYNYFLAQVSYLKSQLKRVLTPAKLQKITGRMAMIRESEENGFENLVSILEKETDKNKDVFNVLSEIVTSGSMAYGVSSKPSMSFRQFLDKKFYSKCVNCKYFSNNDCMIKDTVIKHYGVELFDKWITNPESKNECHYFER